MPGEQGIGMEWGDGSGWRQDEECGFRYVELPGTIDHSHGVFSRHSEPQSWQGKGTHAELGLSSTEVGTEYLSAGPLSELITAPDLGRTNTESRRASTLGSKGRRRWH